MRLSLRIKSLALLSISAISCISSGNIDYLIEETNRQIKSIKLENGVKSVAVCLKENCFTYQTILEDHLNLQDTQESSEMASILYGPAFTLGFAGIESNLNDELAKTQDFIWLANNGYCVSWEWLLEGINQPVARVTFEHNGRKWVRQAE